LQHLQSDRRSGASSKLFLNLLIQFYFKNVTNLHQLTSHSTTSCPTTWRSYRDHQLGYCDVTSPYGHGETKISEYRDAFKARCTFNDIFFTYLLLSLHVKQFSNRSVFGKLST